MGMRRLLVVVIILLFPLFSAVGGEDEMFHVFGLFPSSGSWDTANTTLPAALMAVHDVNAAGGIMGAEINLWIADTACDDATAVAEVVNYMDMFRIADIQPVAFLGGACSEVCTATALLAEAYQIPQISYACDAVTLASDHYPYLLRAVPTGAYGEAMLSLCRRHLWTRLAMFSDSREPFVSQTSELAAYLEDHGIDVLVMSQYDGNWSSDLLRAGRMATGVFYWAMYPRMAREFFAVAHALGIATKGTAWIGQGWLPHDWLVPEEGEDFNDEHMSSLLEHHYDNNTSWYMLDAYQGASYTLGVLPDLGHDAPGFDSWEQRFRTLYPDLKETGYGALAYDAVTHLVMAVNATLNNSTDAGTLDWADPSTRTKLRDMMLETRFDGVSGFYQVDQYGDRMSSVQYFVNYIPQTNLTLSFFNFTQNFSSSNEEFKFALDDITFSWREVGWYNTSNSVDLFILDDLTVHTEIVFTGGTTEVPESTFHSLADIIYVGAFFELFTQHTNETDNSSYWRREIKGAQELGAFLMALDEVNDKSDGIYDDILPHTILQPVMRDTFGDKDSAVADSLRMTTALSDSDTRTVSAVIGPTDDDIAIGTQSVFALTHVPQISHGAHAAELSDADIFPFFFRTVASEELQAAAFADLIAEKFSWYRLSTVSSRQQAQTRNTFLTFYKAYTAASVVNQELSNGTTVVDLEKFLDEVMEAGTRIIMAFVEHPLAELMLVSMEEKGMIGNGYTVLFSETVVLSELDPVLAKGMFALTPLEAAAMAATSAFSDTDEPLAYDNFMQRWREHESWCDESLQNCECRYAVDASWKPMWILLEDDLSLEDLQQEFRCTGVNYDAPTTRYVPYVYDAVWILAHSLHKVVNEWNQDILVGSDIKEALLESTISGSSGPVSFERSPMGDRVTGMGYRVLNHQGLDAAASANDTRSAVKVVAHWYQPAEQDAPALSYVCEEWDETTELWISVNLTSEECIVYAGVDGTRPTAGCDDYDKYLSLTNFYCLDCPAGLHSYRPNMTDCTTCGDFVCDGVDSVYIGGLFPLIDLADHDMDGTLDRYVSGPTYMSSFLIAIDELNNKTDGKWDDILPKTTIYYGIADTRYDSTSATEATDQLISRATDFGLPLSGVVGAVFSESSRSAQFSLRAEDIVQISFASTSDELSDVQQYPYFFRTVPADEYQAIALVDLLVFIGVRRVSVIYSGDGYGRAGAEAVERELALRWVNGYNGVVVFSGNIQQGEEESMERVFEGVRHAETAVVIIYVQNDLVPDLIDSLEDAGFLSEEFLIIGSDTFRLNDFDEDQRWGLFSISPAPVSTSEVEDAYLEKINGIEPWCAYNASNVMECECREDRDSLGEYLWQHSGVCTGMGISDTYPSLSPFAYDAVLALAYGMHSLIERGKTSIVGAELKVELEGQYVSFDGATGHVSFDFIGNRATDIGYEITNGHADGAVELVLEWAGDLEGYGGLKDHDCLIVEGEKDISGCLSSHCGDSFEVMLETGCVQLRGEAPPLDGCTDPSEFVQMLQQGYCDPCSSELVALSDDMEDCTTCGEPVCPQDECVAGTYYNGANCTACPPGTYQDSPATLACNPCEPGTFMVNYGAMKCAPCNETSYADSPGHIYCDGCPENTMRYALGTGVSIQECQCEANYYAVYNTSNYNSSEPVGGIPCRECPQNAECHGKDTPPITLENYWCYPYPVNNEYKIMKCPRNGGCLGGNADLRIPATCAEGHEGRLCKICSKGYWNAGDGCSKCESDSFTITSFFGILFLFIWLPFIRQLSIALPFLYSTISYLQMLVLVSGFDVPWPTGMRQLMASFGFVNFNLFLSQFQCYTDATYLTQHFLHMSLPILMLAYVLLRYLGAHAYRTVHRSHHVQNVCVPTFIGDISDRLCGHRNSLTNVLKSRDAAGLANLWDDTWNSTLFLMNMVYLSCITKSMMIFSCVDFGNGLYLSMYPSESCDSDNYFALEIVGALGIVLYLIGFPVMFTYILFYSGRKPGGGYSEKHHLRYGFLYERFESEYFYWELLVILRKMVFSIIQVFVRSDPVLQTGVSLVVLTVFLVLQYSVRPFLQDRYDVLECVCLSCLGFIVFLGLIFHSAQENSFYQHDTSLSQTVGVLTVCLGLVVVCIIACMDIYDFLLRTRVTLEADVKSGEEIPQWKMDLLGHLRKLPAKKPLPKIQPPGTSKRVSSIELVENTVSASWAYQSPLTKKITSERVNISADLEETTQPPECPSSEIPCSPIASPPAPLKPVNGASAAFTSGSGSDTPPSPGPSVLLSPPRHTPMLSTSASSPGCGSPSLSPIQPIHAHATTLAFSGPVMRSPGRSRSKSDFPLGLHLKPQFGVRRTGFSGSPTGEQKSTERSLGDVVHAAASASSSLSDGAPVRPPRYPSLTQI
eukprot:Rmarinus@m.17028